MARANAIRILALIRTVYLPLHQGTTSAPVAYSTSTSDHDPVLRDQTSYTRCDIESHRRPTPGLPIPPNDTEKIPLPDTLPIPIESPVLVVDDTEVDLGLTPGVSRLPAEDDSEPDPGPLTLAMQKALPDDTRVRILVVGKAGSGKSSLINSIFTASTATASHKELGHDIETEHCPDDNPQLIFHESPGFRSGDETSLQIIQDFVTERTGAKRPESRRLDAIWICVSIPDATHGRLERGVEKVLRLGKVPVVVVFTKFDELTYTAEYNPNASDADNSQLEQLALDAAHEQYRVLCRSLFDKDPGDLPAVNVSVEPEHSNLVKQLIKTTDKNITDSRMAPSPVEWSIEQTGSHDLEIDASIELGGEKYWRILWSLVDFKGQRLQDCLRILHTHIVSLWNFPDRSQYLSSDEFRGKMFHMVEDLASLLVAPSSSIPTTSSKVVLSSPRDLTVPALPAVPAGGAQNLTVSMSNVQQTTQRNIPCVMGYMIDLTIILHELSKSIGNVSPRNVRFAMAEHVISGRETRIHRAIRSFIVETSSAKVIQEDAVIEMVVGLTKEFLVPTDN
ncbi:hypothetical protein BJV78DRAFT_1246992 [Lactifluus subvellereus]|nr:hypothetical protein BJV78DRAFT_1246992 [Lactifluus subvellereus]